MKIIRPSVEVWEQGLSIFKHIERIGRVCYKSEDKITADSAVPFVEKLIKMGHTSVLEHGTVYLKAKTEEKLVKTVDNGIYQQYKREQENPLSKYYHNKYSEVTRHIFPDEDALYVTTNYKVLVENNWLQDLDYLHEPTKYHKRRMTARFILDRAIANEFVRHREFSFTQESTRYCDYSKDKFDNQLTFIEPYWLEIDTVRGGEIADEFFTELALIEDTYLKLLKRGLTPQQARQILPLSLKTELVMTGTFEAWMRFFELRCSPKAHPDAKFLADKLKEEFLKDASIQIRYEEYQNHRD